MKTSISTSLFLSLFFFGNNYAHAETTIQIDNLSVLSDCTLNLYDGELPEHGQKIRGIKLNKHAQELFLNNPKATLDLPEQGSKVDVKLFMEYDTAILVCPTQFALCKKGLTHSKSDIDIVFTVMELVKPSSRSHRIAPLECDMAMRRQ